MYTVLLVDDQEILRRRLLRMAVWETAGFQVVGEASDGREALERMKLSPVDLLLTDIRMPGMDGMDLVREARRDGLASCLVLVSGYQEFSLAREALQYGVFDYLVKPVRPEELASLLDRVAVYLSSLKKDGVPELYPEHRTGDLIHSLLHLEPDWENCREDLFREILACVQNDPVRSARLLEKALDQVQEEVLKQAPWIRKYAGPESLSGGGISASAPAEQQLGRAREILEELRELYARHLFPGDLHPAVGEVCRRVLSGVEEPLTVGGLAAELYLSRNYLGDLFHQETGITLSEYITRVRMDRAAVLLESGECTVGEAAWRLHYSSPEYFSRVFKKQMGIPPAGHLRIRRK